MPVLRHRIPLAVVTLAFLALVLFPAIATLLSDWWWFQEIGYQIVFSRTLTTRVLLFLIAGGLFGGLLFLNLRIAQRGLVPDPVLLQLAPSAPRLNLTAGLRRLSLPLSLFFGVLAGFAAVPAWSTVLRAIHRTPFGTSDPIFSRDVGFYVFTLPALTAAIALLFILTLLSFIAVIAVYWVRGDIVFGARRLRLEPSAGLHIAVLLAALFGLTAVRLWLVDIPDLLYSTTGPLVGASFTDLNARLPALRISAVVAALAAAAVLIGTTRGRLAQAALWSAGIYLGVAIVGRTLLPAVIQKFVVAPTELTRETPYLRHHIAATRRAWGLDSVELRDLRGEAGLTLANIRANAPTIENVRLWDREPLLQTYGQLQEIRTYYDFVSVDDDRYWIDRKYRQVLLSPRELNVASLPTRTFINEHLTFTHGMGLTLAPVNQVTPEGLPVLFIKDLPPVSTVSLRVTRPQIYYGELANEHIFVKTRQREFDHPAGDANVYAEYQGTGGVPVANLFRRLVLAVRFGSTKILFSGDITSESRALYRRDIVERGGTALPFLRFDGDPYMVLAEDGTLKWILDAYTSTSRYPYSQRLRDGTAYMRNSVKVVIDAYHGSVTAYVSDPADPLIRTWDRVFPGILTPLDRMPADLKAHIRYPEDIYRVQTTLYGTYHMEAPEDFYHREDQWQVPEVAREEGPTPFMRHIVMRLPEESQAEFIYMVPFTPRGKDNLAAWMVARNDGDVYGKLRVYRLPRQRLVFGPQQVQNRINQNTEIARQVSLWDRAGSRVIRGELLVIPIEESLLYVQPLYLQAEGGRIPELKRVIVAYENRVVMAETLDAGLVQLFGGPGAPGPERAPVAVAQPAAADSGLQALAAEARRRYEAALQAQREIDWARYGEEMRRLGELLERLGAGGEDAER
jgi:uncharacterized membrane protein (UPF0182 family)